MSIRTVISKGDVHRTAFPHSGQLPLYLGSGSCGCCFDGYGLMNEASFENCAPCNASNGFTHTEHYCHGNYGLDAWIRLYRLCFSRLPDEEPTEYNQELNLYTGRLTSSYTMANGCRVTVRDYFNPYLRDILAVELELSPDASAGAFFDAFPPLLLNPCREAEGVYGQKWTFTLLPTENGFRINTGATETQVGVRCIAESGRYLTEQLQNGGRTFRFSAGKFLLLIGASESSRFPAVWASMTDVTDIGSYRLQCERAWEKRYGESYVDLPDDFAAAMWARSLYFVLCSFSPDGIPSAPMGWAGFGWRFHFPQDISYIHPALLRLGHLDLCRRIVEFYREQMDVMRRNTQRIYGGSGVMWAWIFPFHGTDDLLTDGAPNPYHYEIHNAAYPARMAFETAEQLHDPVWFAETALPIIRESAAFFGSHLFRESDGTYSLQVCPSMSQDEFAAPNGKNYLCALYAARYTFLLAQKCGIHDYDDVLRDGLSFGRLYDAKEQLYRTSEEMTAENWGKEKHPVQLNPLCFLPVFPLSAAEKNAYYRRADICGATKENVYHGWTLATFWLSAAHMGDGEALYWELHRADDARYIGEEGLEFHESSFAPPQIPALSPYYVTTHGLFLQAVNDAFVSDYSGKTVLCGAVPPVWQGAEYHRLHTKDGVFSGIAEQQREG